MGKTYRAEQHTEPENLNGFRNRLSQLAKGQKFHCCQCPTPLTVEQYFSSGLCACCSTNLSKGA